MKKILSIVLATLIILSCIPFTLFTAIAAEASTNEANTVGVQSTPASGATITTNVATIWYTNSSGTKVSYKSYKTLDNAFDGMVDIYKGVVTGTDKDGNTVDRIYQDTDGDGTLEEELWVAAGKPYIKINGNMNGAYVRPNWATNDSGNLHSHYLNADGTAAANAYNKRYTFKFVVDGAATATTNYTITYGTEGATYSSNKYNGIDSTAFNDHCMYSLAFENVNIKFFRNNSTADNFFNANGMGGEKDGSPYTLDLQTTVSFKNCQLEEVCTITSGGSNAGGFFKSKMPAAKSHFITYTFEDCTIDTQAAIGLYVFQDSNTKTGNGVKIDIKNTKWTASGGHGTSSNSAIISIHTGASADITVDETSQLISAKKNAASYASILRAAGKGDFTLNLKVGSQLIMNNKAMTSTSANVRQIFAFDTNGVRNITDNGAIFKASKEDVTKGVTLPSCFIDSTGNAHTWMANGEVCISPYKANVTGDVIFTHVASDDPAANPGNVAYIERDNSPKIYYTNLQAALDALDPIYSSVSNTSLTDEALWEAAGSPVIHLYNDTTVSSMLRPSWFSSAYNPNRVRTVYIDGLKEDGTRAKIISNGTNDNGTIRGMAYFNFTMSNVDMEVTNGYALHWGGYDENKNSGKSTANLINCNISAEGYGNNGMVFKVTGNQNQTKTENYIINFKNADVVGNGVVNAIFLFHHGCAGVLNIDGESSITHTNNRVGEGGDTMFMLGTQRSFEINIASGAILSSHVIATKQNSYQMFFTESTANYLATYGSPKQTINIENGVILSITADADYKKPCYFIRNRTTAAQGGGTVKIGNTATFSVDQNITPYGFGILYNESNALNGEDELIGVIVKKNGTQNGIYGPTVAANTLNGTLEMNVFSTGEELFFTKSGAALRNSNIAGIRYASSISNELKLLLSENSFTIGTLVGRGSSAPTLRTDPMEVVNIPQTKWANLEMTDFYAALVNIPFTEKGCETLFSGRAYITVTYTDGTTRTAYAPFNSENHSRSLYQIATALVALDPAYGEVKIIQDILSFKDYIPENIIAELDSTASPIQSGTVSKQYILSGTTFSNAVALFESEGYTHLSVTNVEGSKMQTAVLTRGSYVITVFGMSDGTVRITVELNTSQDTSTMTPNDSTDTGTLEVVQVGIERDIRVSTGLMQDDNPLNGMCYIVKLADGRAIIIDGGHENEAVAKNIYDTLGKLGIKKNEKGEYVIAAWIFSHAHSDHTGGFVVFAEKYSQYAYVETFMYNFTTDTSLLPEYSFTSDFLTAVNKYFSEAKNINPHANIKYFIGNATISVLYNPELYYNTSAAIDYYNDSALIFKLEIGEKSVLFMTDAGEKASAVSRAQFNDSAFKCDILQITHHGLYTAYNDPNTSTDKEAHTWDNVKAIYNATGATYAFLPMHSKYADDTNGRNGRYTVLGMWTDSKYQISYVTNEYDVPNNWYTLDDSTRQNRFTEFEENGTVNGVTRSSLYGYDRKNKVVNENGLTTYLGATASSPMATAFTLSASSVNLSVNENLYTWLGTAQ